MKLRIKILVGFMAIIALMGILGAVTYSNFLEINEQFEFLIEHDLQVLQNAQQLQKYIVDAETGQRGFIIVGEESFLEPYYSGISGFNELVKIEKQLISDNPSQVKKLEVIEGLFNDWNEQAAIPEIELAKVAHKTDISPNHLQFLLAEGTGKKILDETRLLLDQILDSEIEKGHLDEQILLHKIAKDLVDRETGQRGFLITGDESFLEPYNNGNKNLELHLAELRDLEEEEEEVIVKIAELAKRWEVEAAIPEINTRIAINENPTIFDVSVLLKSGTGKNILDDIRIEFQEFIQIENKLKDKRFETVQKIKTSAEINIAIFVSIAAIVGIGIAMTLSHSINKSLKLLILGTERFGKGEFEPIPIGGDDEISALSSSFNDMAQNIEFSNKRLQEMQGAIDLSSVVSITDKDGIITYVNENFCEVSKYTLNELIGKSHKVIKSKHQSDEFWKKVWDTIKAGRVWNGRIKNKAKDGIEYWQNSTFVPLYDEKNNISQYISISTVITKEINFEEELKSNINQLKKQSNELKLLNIEMKKTEILKEEFVAMISHELKTPLTPILMWAGALQDKKFMGELNEKQTKATKTILNCATELSELISDIFDSYKLDLEKIEFNKHEINIMELMDSTKNMVEKWIGEHQIEIINTTNENITIYSDKKRIDQIFKNLITNSIDFVDQESGKIEINASVNGENVEFMVKDNGVGIQKEFQDELFKKFYQIDTSTTRKHGGSGLGLSICQGMVKGMGGKIWVKSDHGEGTTFYFTLPIVNKTEK